MIKTKKSKKPLLLASAIILGLLILGIVGYFLLAPKNSVSDGVNYAAPTKEEKQSANEQKEKNVERDKTDNAPVSPAGKTINLVLTDANQYDETIEVRAYSRDIYENGGTCTATFIKGSTSFTTQSQAFADATSTQCGALDTPRSKFSEAGMWTLELTYNSTTSKGSVSGTVEVK